MADDATGLDQVAAVGDGETLLGVLLDQQDADAGLADAGERLEQLMGQHRRQAERRFVEQQDFRRRHHRPGDRHHLLLAAAHGARRLAVALREPREKGEHHLEILRFDRPRPPDMSAEEQVLAHRQVAENAAALGHQGDPRLDDLVGRQRRQLAAAEGYRSPGRQSASPAITLRSVLFPAPFAPSMATTSPASTARSMSTRARCLP